MPNPFLDPMECPYVDGQDPNHCRGWCGGALFLFFITLILCTIARVLLVSAPFILPSLFSITPVLTKKLHKNREIVLDWTVGLWEQTDIWLESRMGSVLKLNKNAQRMSLLLHLLRTSLVTLDAKLLELPAQSPIGSEGKECPRSAGHFLTARVQFISKFQVQFFPRNL
jgi:hypothetical protein